MFSPLYHMFIKNQIIDSCQYTGFFKKISLYTIAKKWDILFKTNDIPSSYSLYNLRKLVHMYSLALCTHCLDGTNLRRPFSREVS